MSETFTTTVSIAVGVALSPEILLPGLWIASLKDRALQKSWSYCAGGVVGLLLPLALGFFLSSAMPAGPSWTRFIVRACIGTLLILLGLYTLFKKNKGSEAQKYARYVDRISPVVAAGLGFAVTGLNLKIISMAMAAGHQIAVAECTLGSRILETFVFLGIGMLPFIVPAILETLERGRVAIIMVPCDRFLEKHGRWVTAAILFVIGSILWKGALAIMP